LCPTSPELRDLTSIIGSTVLELFIQLSPFLFGQVFWKHNIDFHHTQAFSVFFAPPPWKGLERISKVLEMISVEGSLTYALYVV
jgi:hypothetical protein